MTRAELKKINNASYCYFVRYLYNKNDFNLAFLRLIKELNVLELEFKDFINSLSDDEKKQLLEVLTRDKEKWHKLDDYLYSCCLSDLKSK